MGNNCEWELVRVTDDTVLIRDIGHDSGCLTITNDAENLVRRLMSGYIDLVRDSRLFYYDSDGVLDELLIEDGEFAGFNPLSADERRQIERQPQAMPE